MAPWAPARATATRIEERATATGIEILVRPAPPPVAWLALAWLLAALFGMPSLAVLLSPRRWDPLSLSAMACGFAIAGFAILATVRARRSRRPHRLVVGAEGVTTQRAVLSWSRIRAVEAISPPLPGGPGDAGAAMGVRIAAARVAHEWRVEAVLEDVGTAVLAQGLDAAAAARIRDRVLVARPQAG